MAEVKYLDNNGLATVWSKVKGIVTPKADKVSGATAGHLAGLNSSGNLTDSGLAADNIAQKNGSYSGMTVGAAEDLVSAESVASEFTSRVTGGSTAVGKGGTALVDKIKGRTLVWNQQVQNGNFAGDNYSPAWSLTANVNASFSSRILTLSNLTGSVYLSQGRRIEPGHKVLLAVKAGYFYDGTKTGSATFFAVNGTNILAISIDNTLSERKFILTAPSIASSVLGFTSYISSGMAGVTLKIDCDYGVSLIDLTLMFGAGNEPSTVAEFEALYPGPYYDYNRGTLISNAATAIETVGWNIFTTENIATGYAVLASDGTLVASPTVSATDYLPVLPEKDYFFNVAFTIGSGAYGVCFYDGNKNYISGQTSPTGYNLVRTSPAGARYMRATVRNASIQAACIGLSDTSRNGTYEPYWRSELELGLGDIKVKSHNIWDEEWSVDGSSRVIPSNNISVSPSTTYYFKISSNTATIDYLDANGATISSAYNVGNSTFTTPANCAFLKFTVAAAYGSTYANDICINLSDPGFNGRYEPYGDGGVISITGGLKSAGTVYDEIGGGKLVKRIESVDMGSLTWGSDTYRDHTRFFSALADSKTDSSAYQLNNQINSYGYISTPKVVADNTVNLGLSKYNNNIYIRNDAYEGNNGSVFQAAMAGVLLYYELAQPIEYELAEAIPTAMRNDPYGTERRLPEDTAAIVTAPFRADITYSTNIKEAVQSMHQNFINVNSMQDFLAELGTLMGGTWTMRPADGKFDFTFTPNPSNE